MATAVTVTLTGTAVVVEGGIVGYPPPASMPRKPELKAPTPTVVSSSFEALEDGLDVIVEVIDSGGKPVGDSEEPPTEVFETPSKEDSLLGDSI